MPAIPRAACISSPQNHQRSVPDPEARRASSNHGVHIPVAAAQLQPQHYYTVPEAFVCGSAIASVHVHM